MRTRIRDPGWTKIRIRDLGSGVNIPIRWIDSSGPEHGQWPDFRLYFSIFLYCRFRRVARRGGAGCCPTTGGWRPGAGPPSGRTRPRPSGRITPPAWAASGGSWPTGDPDPCQLVIRGPCQPAGDPDPCQLVIRILANWWSGSLPTGDDSDPGQLVIRILANWWSGVLASWRSGFLSTGDPDPCQLVILIHANWWSGSLPTVDPDPCQLSSGIPYLPAGDRDPCQLVIRGPCQLEIRILCQLVIRGPCQMVIRILANWWSRIRPQAGGLLSLKLKFGLMFWCFLFQARS